MNITEQEGYLGKLTEMTRQILVAERESTQMVRIVLHPNQNSMDSGSDGSFQGNRSPVEVSGSLQSIPGLIPKQTKIIPIISTDRVNIIEVENGSIALIGIFSRMNASPTQ